MDQPTLASQINAAKTYEALFNPALFGQWATIVVDAAQVQTGQKILDLACGTGILAREVASRIGGDGYVAGVDPNPGMLSVAKDLLPTVDWRQGVAEKIPFPDQIFDTVVSQFGLMFFQDRTESIRQMLRVTKHSGRLVVAVWDSIENIPGYLAEMKLIEDLAGTLAGEAIRAPFALGNRRNLYNLFEESGAAYVSVTTHKGTARFPNVQTMVEAELRGWLPVMGVHLSDAKIDRILQEAEVALAPYTTSKGKVVFDVSAHIVTAKKP